MEFPTYIGVLDFEATCDDVDGFNNEVIEFPTTLLRWNSNLRNYEVVDHFQEFCKPMCDSQLTPFCTQLTGITQSQVDSGSPFSDVLDRHHKWLKNHVYSSVGLTESQEGVSILTWGHWDLREMMPNECARWNIFPPSVYREYVNIKDECKIHYNLAKPLGMAQMLDYLNLELLGRHHSGLDDCKNIARIWTRLITDGYQISPASMIKVSHDKYGRSKRFS